MVPGGYGKRRVAKRKPPVGRRSNGLGVEKKPKPKPESVTVKNQIRSVERMLRKFFWELPPEVREAQEQKLQGLKKQKEIHARLALYARFSCATARLSFSRRKIERRIRRLEKLQRASSSCQAQNAEVAEQLAKLKEDLEYVRFFLKTEKYVSLFAGSEDSDVVDRRNRLRKQIKANIIAAVASGKDLEGSEDGGLLDLAEDDFFLAGTSSDEADADDEWPDKSAREQASSASGIAASGTSSDERNQRQISARAIMPPTRPSKNSLPRSVHSQSRFGTSSSKNTWILKAEISTSSNTSSSRSGSSFKAGESSNSRAGHSSNLSSNSDAHRPRWKRRRNKTREQAYTGYLTSASSSWTKGGLLNAIDIEESA